MDVDPNYDPSDFLMERESQAKLQEAEGTSMTEKEEEDSQREAADDLPSGEMDSETSGLVESMVQPTPKHEDEEAEPGDLWF